MAEVIDYAIDENILTDDKEYFFSFLTDRFEYATELWAKSLEKRFGKSFEPIWVLSSKQNGYFKKRNYLIINKKLKSLEETSKTENLVYLQDYEDLNKEFAESERVRDLINKLTKKQKRVFILGFTSSCLYLENPAAIILGPKPEVATKLDNKIVHTNLFTELEVPRNLTRTYDSLEGVKKNEKYPFFISAAYTSGGHESSIIYKEEDLDAFYTTLREVNKNSPLLVANLIKKISSSPNVSAIVLDKNNTQVICITDQILRGHEYLGNIYPSSVAEGDKTKILQTTKVIGNYLSNLGFRGLFGLDFVIDQKGNFYTVDLNPRRQGGYMCNVLMSNKVDIIELELALALGEKPKQEISYEDFQTEYSWAHTKLKPYYANTVIKNIFNEGEIHQPFSKIGSEFKCIFYPQDSLIVSGNAGYLVISDGDRQKIVERILHGTEVMLSKNFGLYEGI